ncbi:MAG: hypothetical protein L6367_09560 [Cellulomonas sp.]|nr:hypothetical protein [Cellulomonas sp.]
MSDTAPRPRGRTLPILALVVVVLLVLTAVLVWRAVDSPATSASASPSATATGSASASTSAATPTATRTMSTGCPATPGVGTPSGANVHQVIDVDGDGLADQAWITGGSDRTFGITTASGATFSTAITSASPVPASAVVGLVQGDQPIALVDVGREALLFSLDGCQVTAPADAQGTAYTFDRGLAGEGTGVGCSEDGSTLRLAGLNAVQATDGTYTVTRTYVDLSSDGRTATNGAKSTVATNAAATEAVVTTAQEVSCGDAVAGVDGPVEPS